MNVFTILDNFKYKDSNGKDAFLDSASADYHVVGWHSEDDADPFTTYTDKTNTKIPKNADRLTDCSMTMKDATSGTAPAWLQQQASGRVLCHASMYDVQYNRDKTKQPQHIPAAAAGQKLATAQPIAVGTTPMDALLAFCRAHVGTDIGDMKELELDMNSLGVFLKQTEDDDVDGLQAAADENFQLAFQHTDGGKKWFFKQQTNPHENPVTASDTQISDLHDMNNAQVARDNSSREETKLRWTLFAEWWNYVSGFVDTDHPKPYTDKLKALSQRLDTLVGPGGLQSTLDKSLTDYQTKLLKPVGGVQDRFFQRKDPTLMFGQVDRGFDADFLELVQVRLQDQTMAASSSTATGWETFSDFVDNKKSGIMNQSMNSKSRLPEKLKVGIRALLWEFFQLRSSNPINKPGPAPQILPWFHNEVSRGENLGRDLWQSTQPWLPLFLEWEALYYHIPFSEWTFDAHRNLSHWNAKTVHYGVDAKLSDKNIQDVRHVSGRSVLVPQAASALGTTLKNIFATTNPDLLASDDYNMGPDEQKKLLKIVDRLEMLSTPLTGLTSHLLTLYDGAHAKPLLRLPNRTPLPIASAEQAIDRVTKPAGLSSHDLIIKMDAETSLTPYGSSVASEANFCPIKSVTHGQLLFTKLNIVDKFGQVISAIDPKPHYRNRPWVGVTPCLSDAFYPGTIDDHDPNDTKAPATRANCVVTQSKKDACTCIALTPSINQPARLNASFVKKDKTGNWLRCSDWDDPIWGWILVNYADQGLQIFYPNGTFYREIRLGGKSNSTEPQPKYLPFDPPTTQPESTQLDLFIKKLTVPNDPSYLLGVFHMIVQSLETKNATVPPSYSSYVAAAVGRPLALVNAGWSLELADAESQNWSTSNLTKPDRTLLDPNPDLDPDNLTGSALPVGNAAGYTFKIKLGDAERSFDGLVGAFPASDPSNPSQKSDIQLNKLYTEFMRSFPTPDPRSPKPTTDPRISLTPSTTPLLLTPYHLTATSKGTHDSRLQVFGLLIDPFYPVHAYSSILPNKALKLPDWCVENALKRMTAFWQVGPLLVTHDVAAYDSSRKVDADGYVSQMVAAKPEGNGATTTAVAAADPPTVGIPLSMPAGSASGAGATYKFLQPYFPIVEKKGDDPVTRFNAFDISGTSASGADASMLMLEKAPYTVVEGFLQVVKPLAGA